MDISQEGQRVITRLKTLFAFYGAGFDFRIHSAMSVITLSAT